MRSRSRTANRFAMLLCVLGFGALAMATASVAAPAPAPQRVDHITGSGSDGSIEFTFDIRSGPSGESPSGSATAIVSLLGGETFTSTDTSCLSVSGNNATAVGRLAPNSFAFAFFKITVADNGPTGDTFGAAAYTTSEAPACSPITDFASVSDASAASLPRPIVSGGIVVIDAQPLPTSKDECKNGGWRSFGDTFKNQGQCVAFVQRGPKP